MSPWLSLLSVDSAVWRIVMYLPKRRCEARRNEYRRHRCPSRLSFLNVRGIFMVLFIGNRTESSKLEAEAELPNHFLWDQ
jgi:hypothetical protein